MLSLSSAMFVHHTVRDAQKFRPVVDQCVKCCPRVLVYARDLNPARDSCSVPVAESQQVITLRLYLSALGRVDACDEANLRCAAKVSEVNNAALRVEGGDSIDSMVAAIALSFRPTSLALSKETR